MKLEKKQNQKLQIIEELVEKDCSNGRHVQKKLKTQLTKLGKCPESFLKDLVTSKIGK